MAVLDIGSNSVRLVVYERHARSLTPLYNEKFSAALGRGVAKSGRLAEENARRALTAIQRFALVVRLMKVGKVYILATSAVRDASNAADFVASVERIMEGQVRVLSGAEEAHYAALGVVAGIPDFAGVIGDLGGGSLEMSVLPASEAMAGETHELGVIRMQDDSELNAARAMELARTRLRASELLRNSGFTDFCAIGGTWRSLAKIHQVLGGYPLQMVQNYAAPASEIAELCRDIVAAADAGKPFPGASEISSSRRELMPFGAAVLGEIVRVGGFTRVIFSALGVREGYLYELLDARERAVDPLIQASEDLSVLRSRSPAHAADLLAFSDKFFAATGLPESPEERRLRIVACNLADIGWRGHPDFRGQHSVDQVAYGSLTGIDHPGRAFLAEVLAVRYLGPKRKGANSAILSLNDAAASARAKLIGTIFRVAYPMSAAMPGVLERAGFAFADERLTLTIDGSLAFLDGEHLRGRLDQLANAAGIKQTAITVG